MSQIPQRTTRWGPRSTARRLGEWLRGHSSDWQFGVGAAVAFPPVIFQLSMILIGSSLGAFIGLGLAAAGSIGASWLMRPWFETLPRKDQRRITAVPLYGYLVLVALFVACSLVLAPGDRALASLLLFLMWMYHSLYGSGLEPESSAYERLRGRLGRAAPVRVAVHWCGITGVILLLAHLASRSEPRAVFIGAMFTVAFAGLGASLKVLIRVRRLCTALDQHAEELTLELKKLRLVAEEKRAEQRLSAEGAWGKLRRTLNNKVDTGFSLSGVFVLPRKTIQELDHQVHRALRASGADNKVHWQVMARLRVLRTACRDRADTLV